MSFLTKFLSRKPKNSASLAKERLQIVISHQRAKTNRDYLPKLQRELIAVIAKYTDIDEDQVCVELEEKDNCSILELNITLPNAADKLKVTA